MALWGNTDQADNAPIYAPAQKKQKANTATRDAMFGNTSVGTFAADGDEVAAKDGGIAHTGWVLRTEGTGGRAGRVQYEVLVAGGINSDASDDAELQDNLITVDTAPSAQTVTGPAAASFDVVASIDPAGTLEYQWQISTGGAYSDIADAGVYSGATTDTLAISDSTGLDGNRYRVIVSEAADNAETQTTTGVVLTVE